MSELPKNGRIEPIQTFLELTLKTKVLTFANSALVAYLVFNVGLLVLVQMNLEQTGTVKTETNPLADNFCRVNKVVEDSIVNSHQSTTAWTLLLLPVHFPGWLGQNPSLGDKDHMFARELLLEFANQPGLDLLKGLNLRNGHEDNNGLFACADINFLGSSNIQFPKVTLEVRVHLEIKKSLRNGLLEIIGGFAVRLDNLGSTSKRHLKQKYKMNNISR